MATKKVKDFSAIKTNTVYESVEKSTSTSRQRSKASPQEAKERADSLRTQGRKGCKAMRINMAFTPENHDFIKIMAKATGKTMTEFANLVIEAYRNEHPEILGQARAFLDTVNSGMFSRTASEAEALTDPEET